MLDWLVLAFSYFIFIPKNIPSDFPCMEYRRESSSFLNKEADLRRTSISAQWQRYCRGLRILRSKGKYLFVYFRNSDLAKNPRTTPRTH